MYKSIVMGVILAMFTLVGCSSETTPAPTPQVIEKEVIKEVIKEVQVPADPGKLVVYSGRKESLVAPIITQFGNATGIEVEVKYAKTAALANLLLEEGSKSPADLFWAQDPGGLGSVEGILSTLPEDTLNSVPVWAQSPDDKWVGVSGRARTVVYNNKTMDASELPDDMWGFTDPKWKGKIGWAPTNASFQVMVTGMRAAWGEDMAKKWLTDIQANEPIVYPKNTPQVAAAAAGEIEVGFVNHYYLHRFLSEEGEDFSARNHHLPAGGPGSLIMVSGAGILDSGANKENAQKFIDFMLSPVAQQYFASQTFEYPLIEGVKTSLVLTPLAEINSPEIALKDLADLDGTVKLLQETGILP